MDDANTHSQWVAYAGRQLARGVIYARDLPDPVRLGDDHRAFRNAMIRVAALALAAVESMDRKIAQIKRTR